MVTNPLTHSALVICSNENSSVPFSPTVMISPFAVVMITVSLAHVERCIDLAARSMGAGLFMRISNVLLPNIKIGMILTFFPTFLLSWDEIAVTIFVPSVDAVRLPRLMWMGLRDNIDSAIAAISVVLIVIVTISVIAKHALSKK